MPKRSRRERKKRDFRLGDADVTLTKGCGAVVVSPIYFVEGRDFLFDVGV